jgi:hypothetical protein
MTPPVLYSHAPNRCKLKPGGGVMKLLTAAGLALLVSTGVLAQRRAPAPPPISIRTGSPVATSTPPVGALGGPYASIGISRPLGGILPSHPPRNHHGPGGRGGSGYGYVGPIYYVPNASDFYSTYGYSTFDTPANPALYYTPTAAAPPSSQSSQPIIINQYFGSRSATTQTEDGSTTSESVNPVVNPGDPLGTPQKYYLIAYKDHSIYSALAYWLEGDTLHYVTTQNTHNQASLALIDLEQTAKLNADSNVPFSLTGK